jgi:hypothetical protein
VDDKTFIQFEPRIREEIPAEVMARLRKAPYFICVTGLR